MDEKIKEEIATNIRYSRRKKYIMKRAWRRSIRATISSRCRHARWGYKGGKYIAKEGISKMLKIRIKK